LDITGGSVTKPIQISHAKPPIRGPCVNSGYVKRISLINTAYIISFTLFHMSIKIRRHEASFAQLTDLHRDITENLTISRPQIDVLTSDSVHVRRHREDA